MAEPSKYGKALNALKRPTIEGAPESAVPVTPSAPAATGTPRRGKRSDSDYVPTTVYVRKTTKRKAARLLEDMESDNDLSDLVEALLAKWVSEHSHA